MSLSAASATSANYNAATGSGGAIARAIEEIPSRIAAGAEQAASAVGDVASATVSFSSRALQALESGGEAVLHGVENVVTYPFEVAKDVAVGAENLVEGGWNALTSGVGALASGIGSAVHAVVVDLPSAIASDLSSVARTALDDAGPVASAAAGVALATGASPLKAISTLV